MVKLHNVFFEISIGGQNVGKIIFELRNDVVPKTAENFRYIIPINFLKKLMLWR
jgi:cyclophilin family peptidyl-prolyl cis-trans isomerase